MFYLITGEYIAASCTTNNAVNISIAGQGDIGVVDELNVNNKITPLTTSIATVFTATGPTSLTHIILTNVTGSDVTGVSLYLNGTTTANRFVSSIKIKANTTVTLDSSGFTHYPVEVATGGGGGAATWGTITGTITSQTDLIDTFQVKALTLIAGETISSGMAVVLWTDNQVYKYDITNNNHAGLTCGIAKTSGTVGNPMDVTLIGNIHTEVGSGWLVGKSYFISSASLLTITPPTSGICKKIATGIDTDTVFINDYPEMILL